MVAILNGWLDCHTRERKNFKITSLTWDNPLLSTIKLKSKIKHFSNIQVY